MQIYNATGDFSNYWYEFWFEKNLQGDIVAVWGGTQKYISYTYDAWGNFTTQYYIDGYSDLGVYDNPFLYRGYYYDRDLGLYYLQSRYYDSNTGRFISADSRISGIGGDVEGNNLYAYCFNNPVMCTDYFGKWPSIIGGIPSVFPRINTDFVIGISQDISNFDLNNESEEVVLESNYFSGYK
jgi:RHS repeat-associated protein